MRDPETVAHQQWLGYIQPVGLVVSIPALLSAGAVVDRNILLDHQRFLDALPQTAEGLPDPVIRDFPEFARQVFKWPLKLLDGTAGTVPIGDELAVVLPEYHETLRPTYALRERIPAEGGKGSSELGVANRENKEPSPTNPTPHSPLPTPSTWQLLIQVIEAGRDLDAAGDPQGHGWQASPQARFERLLRETRVPAGLLTNGAMLRLVYAPRGESSGYLTFPVAAMAAVSGRPMFAALHMLLRSERLFTNPEKQRLPAILADSRKYQNTVSTKLAGQVLSALFELLRGFQAADDSAKGMLLADVLRENPNHVYGGLLTVLMRLVFVLYAEDRNLLSSDKVYVNHYSVTGLFDRLRAEAPRFTDTMDQRFGAWAQLVSLFRLIYDGGKHGSLKLPARRGYLFDPDRYNFLEGRPWQQTRHPDDPPAALPRVPDGVIYRVLDKLLLLDGERLSYRTLDVEQIGSVYEAVMGFHLEVAHGPAIAIKAKKAGGAPTTIHLDDLLAEKPAERNKWLKAHTDQELGAKPAELLKQADDHASLLVALKQKIADDVTPRVVPARGMILQPSDERRKSGSHYTPRSLTEPIVRTTLKPILEALRSGEEGSRELGVGSRGKEGSSEWGVGSRETEAPSPTNPIPYSLLPIPLSSPTPSSILALKVCDPAMGSGAFLVETCRQLGDELVRAWHAHGCLPKIPPDEDEVLHARRLIAQRCLYGVDKNPMAVDLAKLSLWLATLAQDHPFTFLDHSLRQGDSLVGLTRDQITSFHWEPTDQKHYLENALKQQLARATSERAKILSAREETPYGDQQTALALAEEALNPIRRLGDLIVAAFFGADKPKARETLRRDYLTLAEKLHGPQGRAEDLQAMLAEIDKLHTGKHSISPFHWEVEFPEVFGVNSTGKMMGGFDAIVGNPPFLGGARISSAYGETYFEYMTAQYPPAGHQCDLVGYFFRRSFDLMGHCRCMGLLATNTISQGDTRQGSLSHILKNGGVIYDAIQRYRWPGQAAVVVSRLNISKDYSPAPVFLNGSAVAAISAYLMPGSMNDTPFDLIEVPYYSKGTQIYGQGFLFDDDDPKASPIALMQSVLKSCPKCNERIFPYIGGEELNAQPVPRPARFAIYFSDIENESDLGQWPELARIVRERVKPERDALGQNANNIPLKRRWWAYQAHRPELYAAAKSRSQMLACSQVTAHLAFAFLPSSWIYSQKLCVFDIEDFARFAVLQGRCHDYWAWFLCSTMKDDLNYSSSDCFATFPFPGEIGSKSLVESAGRTYYEFRAALMVRNNEGLTKTYNRFHDPDERSPEIAKLRELHAAMDRAVLDAYGWTDLVPTCKFLLDYEDDEDNDEPADGRRRARKKPWRYRWPDEFRDDVLARLLALNQQRAEEERLAGLAEQKDGSKKPRKATRKKQDSPSNADPGLLPGM